jgi:hypothetical protein
MTKKPMNAAELLAFASTLTKGQLRTLGLTTRADGSTSGHGR